MTNDDRLIRCLEELGEVEAQPEVTRQAIEQTRAVLSHTSVSQTPTDWRLQMTVRVVTLALILAVISVIVPWPTSRSTSVAFADVKAQVNKARTVQYVITRFQEVPPSTRPNIGKEEVSRVMILDRFLKRTEKENAMGQIYGIELLDAKNGSWISIDPINKRFKILERQITIDSESGATTESEVQAKNPEADFYESIRRIPDNVEKLPPRKLNGKEVSGFREIKKQGPITWTRTIWVDPKTKLPVRVEITDRSTNPRFGPSDWVISDFVFDAPLDVSLFDTTPPDDFTVERTTVRGIARPK